jgi:hypothetical protein
VLKAPAAAAMDRMLGWLKACTHGASEAHYAKAQPQGRCVELKGQGESVAPAWPVVVGCDSRCTAGRHGAASLRAIARHHLVCEAEEEKAALELDMGSRR